MAEIVNRRRIMRGCKSRGWIVQPAALSAIHCYLNHQKGDFLEEILNELEQHMENATKLVTETIWMKAMESNNENDESVNNMTTKAIDDLEIVNAFESPRLVFDSMRKTFGVEQKKWPLLGSAADKINMTGQRYALVHQRMLRHEVFRRKTTTYRSSQPDRSVQQHTLTPIESLLGKSNSDQVPVVVLGILVQVEESKFYLEDPTGRVQVSFINAKAADNFYVTESSILLVEAVFQDEILYVDRIGSPFVEQRQKSLQVLQQQVRHPHFKPSSDQSRGHETCFVVLADVHFDQPRVLALLRCLFESYESCSNPRELPVFCFMGNFSSNSHTSLNQCWEEFVQVLAEFEFLSNHAHFVFIPGPNDTRCSILPGMPLVQENMGLLKTMQSYKIKHVHWGSNPCRIRHQGKELVFFRHDTLSFMLQNQVSFPQTSDMTNRTPHSRMVRTIINQGHLMPVARFPIYWNFDHALRLYPLPDALVLGGSSAVEEYENYEECDAIHAGSFSKNGTYAIYRPSSEFEDDMSVESADQLQNRVEFGRVKESED